MKQALLIAKGGVKAGAIDAHGPGEMRERSAFVTFVPKNVHGPIQGRVGIEGARPPNPGRVFWFHTDG